MASFAIAKASSRVSPCVATRGRSGTNTLQPPSASGLRTTSYSRELSIPSSFRPGWPLSPSRGASRRLLERQRVLVAAEDPTGASMTDPDSRDRVAKSQTA